MGNKAGETNNYLKVVDSYSEKSTKPKRNPPESDSSPEKFYRPVDKNKSAWDEVRQGFRQVAYA